MLGGEGFMLKRGPTMSLCSYLLPPPPLLKILLGLVWGFSKFLCSAGLDEGIESLVGVSVDVMEAVAFCGALTT